jgi:hypothetical protein
MDMGAIATICIFLALQTGAAVWNIAVITQTLSDHTRRLNALEATDRETALTVAQLKGRELHA